MTNSCRFDHFFPLTSLLLFSLFELCSNFSAINWIGQEWPWILSFSIINEFLSVRFVSETFRIFHSENLPWLELILELIMTHCRFYYLPVYYSCISSADSLWNIFKFVLFQNVHPTTNKYRTRKNDRHVNNFFLLSLFFLRYYVFQNLSSYN